MIEPVVTMDINSSVINPRIITGPQIIVDKSYINSSIIDPSIISGSQTITMNIINYLIIIITWILLMVFVIGVIIMYYNKKRDNILAASAKEAEVLMITGDGDGD